MQTCKDCKFKGTNGRQHHLGEGFFVCKRVTDEGWEWTKGEDGSWYPKMHATAFVEDGSGYYAALVVTDEFGCTLHEPE